MAPSKTAKVQKLVPLKRTTYVTAWQVGFFERMMKGNQVDVLPTRVRSESRLAKRRKVMADDEKDPPLESRMAETEITGIRQSRTRARPKKKANCRMIVTKFSDNSVEKTVVAAKNKTNEPTLHVLEERPSATSEELAKELTLSEAILEQIVAQVGGTVGDITEIPVPPPPEEEVRSEVVEKTSEERTKALEIAFLDFLQDSVVPSLKYLDKKREKYTVRRESGSYVELIRHRTKLKSAVAVKKEWDSATATAKERVASLTTECATTKATLLETSKEAYEAAVQCAERLIAAAGKRDQLHAEELAKAEGRRAEEA
ncbi:hypothetical protein AXG93_857s1040 [Marchantia polymorpha subsp. ruderalis]|uniref:Uncharacterized protein n=1 Tax=Marchantia polymorpha subsp. ruderalis TaxID=1480154 RepID=A0A176WDT0_MARPO|nr:hypothetical protein AXG93_857s1040 [Marchantia polymorpha subsp. ruderalis]